MPITFQCNVLCIYAKKAAKQEAIDIWLNIQRLCQITNQRTLQSKVSTSMSGLAGANLKNLMSISEVFESKKKHFCCMFCHYKYAHEI